MSLNLFINWIKEMHLQSCCFAHTLITFRRSRCHCRHGDSCLSSILEREKPWIWSRDVLQKKTEKNVKARYLGDFSCNLSRHFTVKKVQKKCLVPNSSVAADVARSRIKLYFLGRLVQQKSSVQRKWESASWSYSGWIHLIHGGLVVFTADLSKSTDQLRDQPERDWRRDWSPAVCPSLPYQ